MADQQNSTSIKSGITSASLYVTFQVVANILSTKIAVLPFLPLAIDGGTVIYPLTFTLRDFVHKVWGKKNARFVVVLAAAVNVFAVLLFWLVGKMSPDPSWPGQNAYEIILLPTVRITAASIVSQLVSELIDTEIFSAIYKKFGDITAVLASNTIAIFADSFLFSILAFGGVLPATVVLQIIISNILIKFVISFAAAPIIRFIPKDAAEAEI